VGEERYVRGSKFLLEKAKSVKRDEGGAEQLCV